MVLCQVSNQARRSDCHSPTDNSPPSPLLTSSVSRQRDIMAKNMKPSYFFPILEFPSVVRNLIWKNTVITVEVIEFGQHGSQHTRGQLAPRILRSGKKIHAEDNKRLFPSHLVVAFTLVCIDQKKSLVRQTQCSFSLFHMCSGKLVPCSKFPGFRPLRIWTALEKSKTIRKVVNSGSSQKISRLPSCGFGYQMMLVFKTAEYFKELHFSHQHQP